ncbi:hypothetical protein COOONC_13316, partial [Cooperia oncophora]
LCFRPSFESAFSWRRDVFGRLSLVCAKDDDDIIISEIVQNPSVGGIVNVNLLLELENVLEPWAKLFSSFTLEYSHCKDDLLKVDANSIAVAFSGGVDSLLVSIALHEAYPLDQTIDLVNVAFIRGSEHRSIVTDRQRAVAALLFLRSRFPARKWCLVLVDVTLEELEENRLKHIVKVS